MHSTTPNPKEHTMKATGRKLALLLAATACALGATAATAHATYYPSLYPTPFLDTTACIYHAAYQNFTTTQRVLIPSFQIDGANLYPTNTVEKQTIYVKTALYNSDTGAWVTDPNEIHGTATGQDNNFWPQADHVQTWYNANNQRVGIDNQPIVWNIYAKGHYWVSIHIRWDRSTSGAPAGEFNWMWLPGGCNFP
jgi:hypothetical protein